VVQYSNYNFGHDEYDYARNAFRRWQWSRNPTFAQLAPTPFGPFSTPRGGDLQQSSLPVEDLTQHLTTASITFKSSRTLLETLFPTTAFRFAQADTVCVATLLLCHRRNLSWLGGRECCSLALYFNNVEYSQEDGPKVSGSYLAILFENVAEALGSGTDEVSLPNLHCDIATVGALPTSFGLAASASRAAFAKVQVSNLEVAPDLPNKVGGAADQILACTYVPPADSPDTAGGDFACLAMPLESLCPTPLTVERIFHTNRVKMEFFSRDWEEQYPILHHLTSTLAEMPVYEVLECKVVDGTGVQILAPCRNSV
jgi:hypothetical protein